MELEYIYFEAAEGGYIGYFTNFPQHVTQSETIEELEKCCWTCRSALTFQNTTSENWQSHDIEASSFKY